MSMYTYLHIHAVIRCAPSAVLLPSARGGLVPTITIMLV